MVTISNSSGGSGSRSNHKSSRSENKSSHGKGNTNDSSNKGKNDSISDFHSLLNCENVRWHNISEFRLGRALGTGQYGTVYEEGNYSVMKKYSIASIT